MNIIISVVVLGLIGLTAGIILTLAYKKLKVEEDPAVERINEILPAINCGACGFASCNEYAVNVASEKAVIDLCKPGGKEVAENIAKVMGLTHDAGDSSEKAVVGCQAKEKKYNADYLGPRNCQSANILGGGLSCSYGCFGYGDCVIACPFDAINLNEHKIPVVSLKKCTGCGLCVEACPRDIIFLENEFNSKIIFVGCSNRQQGKDTRKVCDSGCITCTICVKKSPEGSFEINDNLSKVITQNNDINIEEIKCPTKCIYESRRKN